MAENSSVFLYNKYKKEYELIDGCDIIKGMLRNDGTLKDRMKLLGKGTCNEIWRYCEDNCKIRYVAKIYQDKVIKNMNDIIREKDLWVYSYRMPPDTSNSIKMDVGIEDCLHIDFEYSKSRYHLKDVIVGRIYFFLVRLKIRHMELSLIRRETTGTPPNQYNESETLVRFEIMDGAPVRGETIPIRLFLGGFDLTPTFRDVNKKFSTRTFLSLVLIDEDSRRYFKQSEIILYRK